MLNLQVADRMEANMRKESSSFWMKKKAEVEKTGKKVYNLSVGTRIFYRLERIMKAVEAARKPENYTFSRRSGNSSRH
ncbi:MAG: hypothetical protein V8S42_04360 [Lachnospiraceae bacterium]